MGKRLYCGNLPYTATAEDVRALFAEDGRTVTDVHIVMDRDTGRPRGFAFVELASDEDAAKAVQAVNGRMYGGRPLTVNEARERAPRPGGGPPASAPRGPGGPGPRVDRSSRPPRSFDGPRGPPRGPSAPLPPPPPAPPRPPVEAKPGPDGYGPPEDVDYRERGDRGRRGRDRRGGRRGGDDPGGTW